MKHKKFRYAIFFILIWPLSITTMKNQGQISAPLVQHKPAISIPPIPVAKIHQEYLDVPPSYRANLQALSAAELQELKQKNECQTALRTTKESSPAVRAMIFRAAKLAELPHPELLFVINDSGVSSHATCGPEIIKGKQGRGIKFKESYWKQFPHGVHQSIAIHEVWHLKKRHHYTAHSNTHTKNQEEENECDKASVDLLKCKQCSQEFAAYYLNNHNNGVTKLSSFPRYTLQEAAKIDDATLQKITNFSRFCRVSHPCNLERAVRIVQHAQTVTTLCHVHEPKLVPAPMQVIPNSNEQTQSKLPTIPIAQPAVAQLSQQPQATPPQQPSIVTRPFSQSQQNKASQQFQNITRPAQPRNKATAQPPLQQQNPATKQVLPINQSNSQLSIPQRVPQYNLKDVQKKQTNQSPHQIAAMPLATNTAPYLRYIQHTSKKRIGINGH